MCSVDLKCVLFAKPILAFKKSKNCRFNTSVSKKFKKIFDAMKKGCKMQKIPLKWEIFDELFDVRI